MKWLYAVTLVTLTGCGVAEGENLSTVSSSECSTGKKWTSGDSESPLMHPGMDCISCHASRHEGPTFTVAGTVHAKANEPDDCAGMANATVEITSATGAVTKLTTNEAGNFYTEAKIDFPYTVKVVTAGGTNQMSASQSTGSCASCHTVTGANSAPGRVLGL